MGQRLRPELHPEEGKPGVPLAQALDAYLGEVAALDPRAVGQQP